MIYHAARQRLYSNLVEILLCHETGSSLEPEESAHLRKLTEYLYRKQESLQESKYLSVAMESCMPLIGIGGPAEIIFGDVPGKLGAEAVFPEYKEIANAIGATVGKMSTSFTVRIEPDNLRNWGYSYYVVGGDKVEGFHSYERAKDRAIQIAERRVREMAGRKGTSQETEVAFDLNEDFFRAGGDTVFVLTEVTAKIESDLSDLSDLNID